MAKELPQLNDAHPVMGNVPINSRGEGLEAFANALQKFAGEAEKGAETKLEEQSDAQLMTSANYIDQLKTNTHLAIMKNPDQAKHILNNASYTIDTIKQNSFVNKQDRRKLNMLADKSMNQLNLMGGEALITQQKRNVAISFWEEYPQSMSSIYDAIKSGDFDKAKIIEDALQKNAIGAAKMGAITPEQLATIRKASLNIYDRAKMVMSFTQNAEAHNAGAYHAVTDNPYSNDNRTDQNDPFNADSNWIANHYAEDRSARGLANTVYRGDVPDFDTLFKMSPQAVENLHNMQIGVADVRGRLKANDSYPQIEREMEDLESRKGSLGAYDKGRLGYWKYFKDQLENNNGYSQLIANTVEGGKEAFNYKSKIDAISNSNLDDDKKQIAIRDETNRHISSIAEIGIAGHYSPHLINPIPTPWVQDTKQAFEKDAPVAPAIERIAYLKPENRVYLANAMSDPAQSVATFLAGATLGKADTSFQGDLISFNKKGVDYKSLLQSSAKNELTTTNNIWNDISSDAAMKPIMAYMSKQPNFDVISDGFKKVSSNYVMGMALKNGDITLNNKYDYVKSFVNNTAKGFNIIQGDGYMFNANDLDPNLRGADYDYIAQHAKNECVKAISQGKSPEEIRHFLDLNPMLVVSSPDHRITVMNPQGQVFADNEGNPAYDHYYTDSILHAAHAAARKTQVEAKLNNKFVGDRFEGY